jgi:predicted dehydrogenase
MVKNGGSWNGLSVLIAGCGSIGKRHARILAELGVPDIRACDPSLEQRRSLRAEVPSVTLFDSFSAGLSARPSAVILGTPPEMHVPMAMEAIRAGCHVLCEKPLSDRVEGLDGLEALASDLDRKVMVALCSRFHAGHLRARELLDEGRIGRLASIRAVMGEHLPEIRPDYRDLYLAKRFGAFELMHEIDLAFWYTRSPLRALRSVSGNFSDIGIEAPDTVALILDFSSRCLASIHLDLFQQPRRRQFELIGTTGTIIIEWAQWERCTVSLYETQTRAWTHTQLDTARDDMFRAEDREFLHCISANEPVRCSIAEGRRSVEVVATAMANIAQAARNLGAPSTSSGL